MAACDQGYLCDVCDDEVKSIIDSDLYLRFVIGQISARELLSTRERHLRCNPVVAQFIDDPDFSPVIVEGPFAMAELDADYVAAQKELITRGWQRLRELAEIAQTLPISDYPLPEFRSIRE